MNLSFPLEVQKELGYYVYRLIDPRNGETFYIGKGKGDRVFHHIKDELAQHDLEDSESTSTVKLERIRDIRSSGLDVLHIIQRHGLDSDQALLVEAALIDVFPGLTNIQGGHGNSDVGAMHSDAIIRKYRAPKLIPNHRIVFFTVHRNYARKRGLYDACRGVWRMSLARAEKAELVMPVVDGIVEEVFRPVRWLEATPSNFPNHVSENIPGRYGFEGVPAEHELVQEYKGKRLPDELVGQRKSQNPVRYSYEFDVK